VSFSFDRVLLVNVGPIDLRLNRRTGSERSYMPMQCLAQLRQPPVERSADRYNHRDSAHGTRPDRQLRRGRPAASLGGGQSNSAAGSRQPARSARVHFGCRVEDLTNGQRSLQAAPPRMGVPIAKMYGTGSFSVALLARRDLAASGDPTLLRIVNFSVLPDGRINARPR
jgi:hypothetical protein